MDDQRHYQRQKQFSVHNTLQDCGCSGCKRCGSGEGKRMKRFLIIALIIFSLNIITACNTGTPPEPETKTIINIVGTQ